MNSCFLTETDRYIFGQGNHYEIYNKLGAHLTTLEGREGVHFAVWAPNAVDVRIVGDFNGWNAYEGAMMPLETSGIWERFIPDAKEWDNYKFAIQTRDGRILMKSDPYAFHSETRPGNASKIADINGFNWTDGKWKEKQKAEKKNRVNQPMSIYEVHLGSWKKNFAENVNGFYDYKIPTPIAPMLRGFFFSSA